MNIRTFIVAGTLALSASPGLVHADTSAPQPYYYGMPLHIAKVVSLTEPDTLECKVVTAEMKFIDTAGQTEDISYRKMSEACSTQG